MDDPHGTIVSFKAREREQAATMTRDDLVDEILAKRYLEKDKPLTVSVIGATLGSKRRTEATARERFMKDPRSSKDTHPHPYFNVLRTCIYLERLNELLEEEGQYTAQFKSPTECPHNLVVAQRTDDHVREYPRMAASRGPSIDRGAPGSKVPFGSRGAPGAKMALVAQRPNPSSGASKGLDVYSYSKGLISTRNPKSFEVS